MKTCLYGRNKVLPSISNPNYTNAPGNLKTKIKLHKTVVSTPGNI